MLILLIVVTLIIGGVSYLVLFLVWLFAIGSCRAIRTVRVEALWACSIHVHTVLCARWQEQSPRARSEK